MFLTSDLCYVEMHRSGSTHLVKLFEKYMPDGKKIGVHNRPDQEIYDSNRFFVGSIRNPWEWYVSLWSFGCVKKGTLYGRLTSKNFSTTYNNDLKLKKYIILEVLMIKTMFKNTSTRSWKSGAMNCD